MRLRPVGAVLLLFLVVLTLATARSGDPQLYPPKAGDAQAIWLIDNGFHTDLALPRAAIIAHGGPLAAAAARTGAAPWIMVGWGDARSTRMRALGRGGCWTGSRGVGRPGDHRAPGGRLRSGRTWRGRTACIASRSRSAGLAALMARDRPQLRARRGRARRSPLAVPRQPGEAFFASGEGFSGLHDCNDWTAELLNAAGLPMTPVLGHPAGRPVARPEATQRPLTARRATIASRQGVRSQPG